MKEQTIAGDIRRLRDLMTIHNGSVLIKMDYCELLKLFDSIETKAKRMQDSLEPVLAVGPSSFETDYFKGGSWVTPVYDGKLCEAAVLEAQRIYLEGQKDGKPYCTN